MKLQEAFNTWKTLNFSNFYAAIYFARYSFITIIFYIYYVI